MVDFILFEQIKIIAYFFPIFKFAFLTAFSWAK